MNNGKICVSVCAETADEMFQTVKRAEEYADVIELRFDKLDFKQLDKLLGMIKASAPNKPLLSAMHTTVETKTVGDYKIPRRYDVWAKILQAKISEYFDPFQCGVTAILIEDWNKTETLPLETKMFFENAKNQKFIFSYHNFELAPQNLDETYQQMKEAPADILKFAVQAEDITDGIPVWKLLKCAQRENKPIIPIAMGEAGKWTRILGPAFGASMTYASLDAGEETAPGQLTAKDLIETYRVKDLDSETKVFGIIGDPISQSLSPYIHNPAFVSSGFNAVFIPLLVKNLDGFMRRMVRQETSEVELNFGGFSVTMPHKQSIIKHLDMIDPTAEKIGAVNTVKIEDGRLTGYNTDAYGFITPLKAKFGDLDGVRVGVFGAGGAARAVVFALRLENADVTVLARDAKKAQVFAKEFSVRSTEISNFESQISNRLADSFEIVVNTTPLGMNGRLENESLFAADELLGVNYLYDLVTKVGETPIIREAKKAGVPAMGGLEMLLAQGAKQFEIWTGREAPVDIMKASVETRMTR